MGSDTTKSDGTSDESIGRPTQWREGRYEKDGKPLEPSVLKKPGEGSAPPEPASTPVTRKDYE
ncbi:MAG: hypothetical protein ACYDAH_08020 [Steroidobacteraceae bacterium]